MKINGDLLVALIAAGLSIAVKVVGMPAQISHNYRRKSTEGLSGRFLIITLISCAAWVVQGLQVHDTALVVGQGLGVIASTILVVQMIVYHPERSAGREGARAPAPWHETMPS